MSVEIINYYEFVIFSYYETFWFLGINGVYVLGFKWFALLLFIFDYFFLQGLVFKLFHIIFSIQYHRKYWKFQVFGSTICFPFFVRLVISIFWHLPWICRWTLDGRTLILILESSYWSVWIIRIDRCLNGWTAERPDGWLGGWMNEWMNEWTDIFMDEWVDIWLIIWESWMGRDI